MQLEGIRSKDEAPLRAGLVAVSGAGIVAALVSLPLRSPDDILFNTATVVLGALVAGIATGVVWRTLGSDRTRSGRFAILLVAGFAVVALLAVLGEKQLDHFAAFVLPLAAIVFLLTGLLTPLMAPSSTLKRWWLAPAVVVLALAVGIGLAGQGDQESGKLELPPRASISDGKSSAVLRKRIERLRDDARGGLVCLNSAARFDKWNRAAVR